MKIINKLNKNKQLILLIIIISLLLIVTGLIGLKVYTKYLNNDKNKLNKILSEDNTKKDILSEQYEEIEVAPAKHLDNLESFITSLEENNGRLMRLEAIIECIEKIKEVQLYEELTSVDYDRLVELQNIVEYLGATKISLYDNLDSVSLDRLNELRKIISLRQELSVDTYDKLDTVDIERFKDILNICEVFNNYSGVKKSFEKVDSDLSMVRSKLVELSEKYNLHRV